MSTSSRGFTLIEVLLVVTIMAILTVGSFSGMVSLQRSARVNETYSRLVTFLDLARNYALNGKQVNNKQACPAETNGNCVPASFGVSLMPDSACVNTSVRMALFYSTKDDWNVNPDQILDSYCVPAKVGIESSKTKGEFDGPNKFRYTTPFGIFRAVGLDEKNLAASALILTICDTPANNAPCAASSLSKSLTLYTNVGVPE